MGPEFMEFPPMSRQDQSGVATTAGARLADKAYCAVLERILVGALPAGAVVPERRLSEDIGLSRSRLREALSRLEGEGVLTRNRAHALCVRDVTLHDALFALQILQSVQTSLAIVVIRPEALSQLSAIETAIKAASPYGSVAETGFLRAVMALRRIQAEDCSNPFAAPVAHLLWQSVAIYQVSSGHQARAEEIASALNLCHALRRAAPDEAKAAAVEHVNEVRNALLAAV
jgi:DNA-binding GntR family transcriptional regulator